MRKFRELWLWFLSTLRRRSGLEARSSLSKQQATALGRIGKGKAPKHSRNAMLTLPRPAPKSPMNWELVQDQADVRQNFVKFRDFMYRCNQKTRQDRISSPKALWEAGKLTDGRQYFYLQPWNERGYLFEESSRGWVISRAEKIAERGQFMRERGLWDMVTLHVSSELPGALRLSSEQMGEALIQMRLYEEFMAQAFQPEGSTSKT